ncbi:cupin domain-containing protein [Ferrimonas balearica]|uniref:cupin domain-containing protein n=1 Tax=Ferrimonas balearica TaxID=44012 RepID=UPI001C56834E|nr:cupin domain-containing protein [Ferrimonas balearica]MBW3137913.1 cupin domain-containing protein [Ferrimonas balearica]MBY6104919.1 cupin domain-containing protein [Ferrimonas balearica]
MKPLMTTSLVLALVLLTPPPVRANELALSLSPDDSVVQWGPCPAFFPDGCELAVIHGDPAKPNADILFKIPGGYAFPAHWHTSAERMVLVSGEMSLTYQGQQPATLKTGMYAYGPAKAVHHGQCVSSEPCILVIAFEAPVDAFEADESP